MFKILILQSARIYKATLTRVAFLVYNLLTKNALVSQNHKTNNMDFRIFEYKSSVMEPLQNRIDILSNWLKSAGNESVVTQFERLQQELNKVVGYEVDGTPITTAKLLVDIATAEQQISDGNYTSQEDLEKESENW